MSNREKGSKRSHGDRSVADTAKEETHEIEEAKLSSLLFGHLHDQNVIKNLALEAESVDKPILVSNDDQAELAWVDDDDADVEVNMSTRNRLKKLRATEEESVVRGSELESRLRSRFEKSNFVQAWAKPKDKVDRSEFSSEDEFEGGNILASTNPLLGGKSLRLPPDTLSVVRCKDANLRDPSHNVVRSVQFHSNGNLLLTAGLDKSLRFFQIDGDNNNKIHGIFFKDFPIHQASFLGDNEVIVTGKRPFFFHCNVETGLSQKVPRIFGNAGRLEKDLSTFATSPDGQWIAFAGSSGYIMLLSSKTKQWVADFKINCLARALVFSPDSQCIIASGDDAEVYAFDIKQRRCLYRMYNEGGTGTSSIDVSFSGSNQYLAVGSDSGVVNIYDNSLIDTGKPSIGIKHPKPLHAIMNITTPVSAIKFNSDSQIMAILSSEMKDALKLVHVSSGTVFSNWPTARSPIRCPNSIDFSPKSNFVAIGNDRGRVLLYRLHHYS